MPKISNLFHFYHHSTRRQFYFSRRRLNPPMELEVTLRLPDSASHQRLSYLPSPLSTPNLTSKRTSSSTTITPSSPPTSPSSASDSRCIICLNSNPVISDGIKRVEEDEESIEPALARTCVTERVISDASQCIH